MVERRDLSRHQGRRNESRPMRHQIAELPGMRRGVQRDEEAFGGRCGIADEREIKARVVVGAGILREVACRQAAFDDVQRRVRSSAASPPIIPIILTGMIDPCGAPSLRRHPVKSSDGVSARRSGCCQFRTYFIIRFGPTSAP
jgi:hypothetical protein